MKRRARSAGWTMMEMMVVIAIISMIIAIAMPNVTDVRNRVYREKAELEMEMLATAIQHLMWDTGRFPGGDPVGTPGDWDHEIPNPYKASDHRDLAHPDAGLMACNTTLFPDNWRGPYLKEVPVDPWGKVYCFDPDYHMSDGTIRPCLLSRGPNGTGIYDSDNIVVMVDTRTKN